MALSQALTDLIGTAPAGYEPLFYVFTFLVFLWLLGVSFNILWTVISWIGGR